jgi:RNA-binding protein
MSDDTTRLPSSARAALRSRANGLKATVQVGKEGVTDAVARTLEQAFVSVDLLKVKVLEMAPLSAREAAPLLAERIDGAFVVQTMGRVVTLYRELPEQPAAPAKDAPAKPKKPRRMPTRGKKSDAKQRSGASGRPGGSTRGSRPSGRR